MSATVGPTMWNFESGELPHREQLYKSALRLTRSVQDAEDLLQETYLKAFKYYQRFSEGTNFKAWLFKIMKNTFINGYRKRQNRPPESAFSDIEDAFESSLREDVLQGVKNPEEQVLDTVLDADVQRALDNLPTEYRMVILLVDLEGFSYKEAAAIIDVPVGTVMSRLYRGRRLLEQALLIYARRQGYLRGNDAPQKMRTEKRRKPREDAS